MSQIGLLLIWHSLLLPNETIFQEGLPRKYCYSSFCIKNFGGEIQEIFSGKIVKRFHSGILKNVPYWCCRRVCIRQQHVTITTINNDNLCFGDLLIYEAGPPAPPTQLLSVWGWSIYIHSASGDEWKPVQGIPSCSGWHTCLEPSSFALSPWDTAEEITFPCVAAVNSTDVASEIYKIFFCGFACISF